MDGSENTVRLRLPRPRVLVLLALALLVVMMIVGGRLGRAETVASYRPVLPPPAFAGACDPFPADVDLDLAYQVRSDRILATPGAASVRRLDLHYDLLDEQTARARISAALGAAGFTRTSTPAGADPEIQQWWAMRGYGRVGVTVAAFASLGADSIVRGTVLIDVPASTLTSAVEAACDNPVQTKRFPEVPDE